MTDTELFDYEFSVWPSHEGWEQPMYRLFDHLKGRIIVTMTESEWTSFQGSIERQGLTFREVERTPAQAVEDVDQAVDDEPTLDTFMLGVLMRQAYEAEHDQRPGYLLALDWVLDGWRSEDDPKRVHLALVAEASAAAMDQMDAEQGLGIDGPKRAES